MLLLLDRNIDLISVVSHGWTYQALASDCLEMSHSRITIPCSATQPEKRGYDISSEDFFWAKNASNPFPVVAEEIDIELNKYKHDVAEITRTAGINDVNNIFEMCRFLKQLVLKLKSH